jgi:hypothetical protein
MVRGTNGNKKSHMTSKRWCATAVEASDTLLTPSIQSRLLQKDLSGNYWAGYHASVHQFNQDTMDDIPYETSFRYYLKKSGTDERAF